MKARIPTSTTTTKTNTVAAAATTAVVSNLQLLVILFLLSASTTTTVTATATASAAATVLSNHDTSSNIQSNKNQQNLRLRHLVSDGGDDNDGSNNVLSGGQQQQQEGPQSRIFGGWGTIDGRYNYAEISLISSDGHKCGGALIAPDILLSAAHCQWSESRYREIVVGKHHVGDLTWEPFNVAKEFVHPGYNPISTRFDVMLIKSSNLIEDTPPVRVNTDSTVPVNEESLTVIGMGYTEDWRLPSSLLETSVTYTRNLDCVDFTSSTGQTLKNDLQLDMLCAGDPGRDSCYGDSGSPLIRRGNSPETDIAVGVVSWGYECGGDLPGVYARLSYWEIQEFIKETVCRESQDPPAYFGCPGSPTEAPTPWPTPQPTTQATSAPQQSPALLPGAFPTETEDPTSGELWDAVMGRDEDDPEELNGSINGSSTASSSSSSSSSSITTMSFLAMLLVLILTLSSMFDVADAFIVDVGTCSKPVTGRLCDRRKDQGVQPSTMQLDCICINCKWVTSCKAYHFVETKHEQPHMTSNPTFMPRDGSPKIHVNIRTEKSNSSSSMWSQIYAEHSAETRRAMAEAEPNQQDSQGSSSGPALVGPTKYDLEPTTTLEYDVVACEDFVEDQGCWVRNMPDEIEKVNPQFVPT
eukprot:CAMPEP_0113523116 /NCGR_PEP_ID=MMETSP0014_2-20120614/45541_1 /TAXON_ID=2857 /ORGANISM="Nitzschia sp." /LENGTH=638 /DNA_ID=CAMNT_0000421199 /DNA_START=83 /DNA_END=1999 /DNA_ORIENTATION=+ /assembly_acc=CAM_ASM_000159